MHPNRHRTINTPIPDSGFAEFWSVYPKKKSKGDAEKAWRALKPNERLVANIIAAVDMAKTSVDWCKDGGQYIPHPATWLRAKGWEDEMQQPSRRPVSIV